MTQDVPPPPPIPVIVTLSATALEALKQPPAPPPPAYDFTIPTVAYIAAVSGGWAASAATCIEQSCTTVTPTLPTVSTPKVALAVGLLVQGSMLWAIHAWVKPRWPKVALGLLYSLGTLHAVAAGDHVSTSRRRAKGTL